MSDGVGVASAAALVAAADVVAFIERDGSAAGPTTDGIKLGGGAGVDGIGRDTAGFDSTGGDAGAGSASRCVREVRSDAFAVSRVLAASTFGSFRGVMPAVAIAVGSFDGGDCGDVAGVSMTWSGCTSVVCTIVSAEDAGASLAGAAARFTSVAAAFPGVGLASPVLVSMSGCALGTSSAI